MADDTDIGGLAGSIFGKSAGFLNDALSRGQGDLSRSRDMEGNALQGGLSYFQNWDQNHPTNLPLLMGAGAMLAPTKTGAFSESLGNAFTAGGGALQQAQKAEMERQEKMMRIQMAQSALARKPYEDSLALANQGFGGLNNLSSGSGVVSDFQFLNGLRGGHRADAGAPGDPQTADATPAPDAAPAAPTPDLSTVAAAPDAPAPAAAAPAPAPAESKVALNPDVVSPNGAEVAGQTGGPGSGFVKPDQATVSPTPAPASSLSPAAPMLPGEGSVGIAQAQRIVQMYNADPSKFRGPQAQRYLAAAQKIIAESPENKGLIAGNEAAQKAPYENQKKAFENNYTAQEAALKEAQGEARMALNQRQQAQAARDLFFDKNGNALIKGGPMGPQINKMAGIMQQWGFSPETVKSWTGTTPANAQGIEKMRGELATEAARNILGNNPVRVTEFNEFLRNTPGDQLLPSAFKWLVDNSIIPKANATVERFDRVAEMDPGQHNIRAELWKYDKNNPWYTGGTPGPAEHDAADRKAAATPSVPPAQAREVGTVYTTPKGDFRWMGNGWQKAN